MRGDEANECEGEEMKVEDKSGGRRGEDMKMKS